MTEDEFSHFKTTADVGIPAALIDQVIGQDEAVAILKQAAAQRRFVLLVGEPGTGKSLLGKAMSEMLDPRGLQDLLCLPNPENRNLPLVKSLPAGQARAYLRESKERLRGELRSLGFTMGFAAACSVILGGLWAYLQKSAAYAFGGVAAAVAFHWLGRRLRGQRNRQLPKILIERTPPLKAPFVDATGSQAGSLLGDVRHDPFQSGGAETPTHELIEVGAIHRAHQGVLYIDEVGVLGMDAQQSLLSAIQERSFAITGRSLGSSGLMVRTEPAPCDFVLMLAGNLGDLEGIHPALRSRIRGYGYEVFTHDSMPDNPGNRRKMLQFIAQEVRRDGRIPHFSREAALELIEEARRQSGSRGRLTLKLRNLGGLVRAAGDLARGEGCDLVAKAHVLKAKALVKPLELQIIERKIALESKHVLSRAEPKAGQLSTLGVLSGCAGAPLTFACAAYAKSGPGPGALRCDPAARERLEGAFQVAGALARRLLKADLAAHEVSFQVLQDYDNLSIEKDSAAAVLAILSAVAGMELRQDCAVLGAVHINGDLHPCEQPLLKLEGAIQCGFSEVVLPRENMQDALLDELQGHQIRVLPMDTLQEVLDHLTVRGPARARSASPTKRKGNSHGRKLRP